MAAVQAMDLRVRETSAQGRFEASKNDGDVRWTVGAGQTETLGRLDGVERHETSSLDSLSGSWAGPAAYYQRSRNHPTSSELSRRPADVNQAAPQTLRDPRTGRTVDNNLSTDDASRSPGQGACQMIARVPADADRAALHCGTTMGAGIPFDFEPAATHLSPQPFSQAAIAFDPNQAGPFTLDREQIAEPEWRPWCCRTPDRQVAQVGVRQLGELIRHHAREIGRVRESGLQSQDNVSHCF